MDIDRVIAGIFHAFLNLSALIGHLFRALYPQRRSPCFMPNAYASCICIINCWEVKLTLHPLDIERKALESNLRELVTSAACVRLLKSHFIEMISVTLWDELQVGMGGLCYTGHKSEGPVCRQSALLSPDFESQPPSSICSSSQSAEPHYHALNFVWQRKKCKPVTSALAMATDATRKAIPYLCICLPNGLCVSETRSVKTPLSDTLDPPL